MFRSNYKLYNLFKSDLKLPNAKAEGLVNALDEKVQVDLENAGAKYKSLWKEDLTKLEMNLRGDMSRLEVNLRGEMNELKVGLRDEMSKLEMNLRDKINDSKSDLIKWMFGIFLTLALMILGIYFKN